MSEKILMGKIVTAVGIKGEVKVYSYSNDGFNDIKHIYLDDKKYPVSKSRMNGNTAVLKLKDVNDRNTAESLVNKEVYIKEEDLKELPENKFYFRDLIGCTVFDKNSGGFVGEITDVIEFNASQATLEIKCENGKKFLLPFVAEFIKEVDVKEKKVNVALIPGFIDGAIEV